MKFQTNSGRIDSRMMSSFHCTEMMRKSANGTSPEGSRLDYFIGAMDKENESLWR
jgi:hypothetical protein